ncbi:MULTISPECIES: hypothetical protein [unclassified Isoptericola]|uniref:hypothetical protein n=1 Tax=unclassified Isoptericola TaxID=2623355 RepID=UPI00364A749F
MGRRGRLVATLVAAAAVVPLTACSPDEAMPVCGLLDEDVVRTVTGDLTTTAFGAASDEAGREVALDPVRRQGNGVDCTISNGSEQLLTVFAMDVSHDAERDEMRSEFAEAAEGSEHCAAVDSPAGYVCRDVDDSGETYAAFLFDDRWVRVTARYRDDDEPPSADVVLGVARNVDATITAYDAAR